mmetsp:Transcript_1140/g.1493  ORF Transcript_1140/g.1493 Transcript_1140/m.1493 type:complete len:248 (+) Transcript_1140:767-1510(+)
MGLLLLQPGLRGLHPSSQLLHRVQQGLVAVQHPLVVLAAPDALLQLLYPGLNSLHGLLGQLSAAQQDVQEPLLGAHFLLEVLELPLFGRPLLLRLIPLPLGRLHGVLQLSYAGPGHLQVPHSLAQPLLQLVPRGATNGLAPGELQAEGGRGQAGLQGAHQGLRTLAVGLLQLQPLGRRIHRHLLSKGGDLAALLGHLAGQFLRLPLATQQGQAVLAAGGQSGRQQSHLLLLLADPLVQVLLLLRQAV